MPDRFKDIDYIVAPTAGIGHKFVATDRTTFDVDTSVGMMFEKNTGLELESDGGDALYAFSAGVAASVTTRVQLKLEFQDVYKSWPTGDADKNDIAFITAFVYKF